jgi:hypothetical protein
MGATDPQVHVERASRLSDNHVVERARKRLRRYPQESKLDWQDDLRCPSHLGGRSPLRSQREREQTPQQPQVHPAVGEGCGTLRRGHAKQDKAAFGRLFVCEVHGR